MKSLKIIFIFIAFCSLIVAQEKTEKSDKPEKQVVPEKIDEKVDKKLDPLYLAINFDDIISKRRIEFRKRKGNVPEQLWKIKTNGVVTVPPIMFETKLLVGTSTGTFNYLDFKTGEADKKSCAAGGLLVWSAIQNNNRVAGMTWVGTVVSFAKDWEHFMVTNFSAYKSKDVRPLGALVWGAGCIVTRRDNFPVMIDSKEDKIISQPSRTWANGEATAPLINSGSAFWIATSKGELISFDINLANILSVIRLGKSYATALASDGVLIYALTASKELIAYDIATSLLKWKQNVSGNGVNSMVCEGGFLYVNAGSFYVINGDDGKVLLERKSLAFENFMRTKPLLTGKKIFTCDSEGNIFIFNKKDLKFIHAINLDEDVMVDFFYLDQVLFVPTIAGFLYAIDVSLY